MYVCMCECFYMYVHMCVYMHECMYVKWAGIAEDCIATRYGLDGPVIQSR